MNAFLSRNFSKLFVGFLLMHPILDVVTSLMTRFMDFPVTLGIVVRTLFLALTLVYYIVAHKSEHKKKVYIYLGVLLTYIVVFLIMTVLLKPVGMLFSEVKSLIKTFYFPILLVLILDIYYAGEVKISKKQLLIVASVYFLLIFLPYITSTGFQSYSYEKPGISGWFYAANETGSILGLLFTLIVFFVMRRNENGSVTTVLLSTAIVALCIFLAFNIGTKVPMLSVYLSLVMVLITAIIRTIRKEKRAFISIISIVVLLIATVVYTPFSPIGKNLGVHLKMANVSSISDFFDDDSVTGDDFLDDDRATGDDFLDDDSVTGDNESVTDEDKPTSVEEPDNSTNVIFSNRDLFNASVKETYKNSTMVQKFFGLGYNHISKTQNEIINVERDFHNVFYRQGIVGFVLWDISLVIAALLILKYLRHPILNSMVYTKMMYICGIVLALGIGFISGHVFTAPAVAIYPIIYMCKLNDELKEKTEGIQR